jgi:hypothetical protein
MFGADDGDTKKEEMMMKNVRIFAVLAVFTMALTGLSLAQQPSYRLVADVPFDFNVGNHQLPAGSYMFVVEYGSPVVTVLNTSTGQAVMADSIRGDEDAIGGPVAVFEVIGKKHTLADLKAAGHAVSFPETKVSVALAKSKTGVAIIASLR